MSDPSPEQESIIDEVLVPLSVIACAGSGKTFTAVRRIDSIRSRMSSGRAYVALLSFSNIAVDVFGKTYLEDIAGRSRSERSRVSIETFDGFITTKILRPHAHRVMKCNCLPFLLTGTESFLSNWKYQFRQQGQQFPLPIENIEVELNNGVVNFFARYQKSAITLESGLETVARLGAVGGYTHNLGRYWAYEVLRQEPEILRALAKRYSHVVIDEAQDVGSIHIAILNLLSNAGSQVTLIGDPHQAIYEFCGADGAYLKGYPTRAGVKSKQLTVNRRSVPRIVAVANSLAKRADTAFRPEPSTANGAYFVPYEKANEAAIIVAFQKSVVDAGLSLSKSAIVCRAGEKKRELRNFGEEFGQGVTKQLAAAAMARDSAIDYQEAFRTTARAIVSLLKSPPDHLCSRMLDVARYPEYRELRKVVWQFARDTEIGLPSASLKAASEWHPLLVARVKAFLKKLQDKFGYEEGPNLGQRLAKKKLSDEPMLQAIAKKTLVDPTLRIETIHGVKGESLDAVLYLAKKEHLKSMVEGTDTEVGRIGYVALTRARNLFWLGITKVDAASFRSALLAHSFVEHDYSSSSR